MSSTSNVKERQSTDLGLGQQLPDAHLSCSLQVRKSVINKCKLIKGHILVTTVQEKHQCLAS